jgi:hypothetical protein
MGIAWLRFDPRVPAVLQTELEKIAERVRLQLCDIEARLPHIVVMSDCSHARTRRNFAAVDLGRPGGVTMYLCDDLAQQPITRIRGILWHEMGHIICKVVGPPTDWEQPAGFGADEEQLADLAVEGLCGVTIYYDDDLVQRAGPGARGDFPRPKGLR